MNQRLVSFSLAGACALGLLFACVPADQLPPGSIPGAGGTTNASSFPDIEGGTAFGSTHFDAKGYIDADVHDVSNLSETLYTKIINDFGIYNAMAGGKFTLTIYRDQTEYQAKTHQPAWSRAIAAGSGIYTYDNPDLKAPLAHQMAHLVMNAYLAEKANNFKWLVEGIAMFEEVSQMGDSDRAEFQSSMISNLRNQRQGFSQMTFFTPMSEENRRTDVWYQEVESVVSYLVAQGGGQPFGNMLSELKNGADIDKALADSYPAKFRSLNDLETAWKMTVQ